MLWIKGQSEYSAFRKEISIFKSGWDAAYRRHPQFLSQNSLVENLLALTDLHAVLKHLFGDSEGGIIHLFVIDEDAALLNQLTSLLVGRCQTAGDHQVQEADLAVH